MVALYGAGILGSFEFGRLRQRERAHQESLHRAAAMQLQSERLVVLGTLAAGVAHEINNPLAYVSANMRHLQENDTTQDDERADVWRETRSGLRRIGAIVSDLKGLSRSAPKGVEATDVERLLRQTARLTSLRGAGVRVETVVEDHLPPTLADEQRLAQVLINLAVNAFDALEESRPEAPLVRLSAAREGDHVVISVEDNGKGVPPEVLSQLFTPFFTTKAPGHGTGLGLALSREYLETFGARITCDASALGGARFRVLLPIDVSGDDEPPAAA
jgi:C4-dicarboxylate-specific signal transduction histidine kinase